MWCVISRNGERLCQVADTELSDLAYAIRKAVEESNAVRKHFKEDLLQP